jgi:hypothetical protein
MVGYNPIVLPQVIGVMAQTVLIKRLSYYALSSNTFRTEFLLIKTTVPSILYTKEYNAVINYTFKFYQSKYN